MIYEIALTIPADRPESNKIEERQLVWGGVIHEIWVLVPAGQKGLAHLQLVQAGHQFAPSTEGQSFYGDDILIHFKEHYRLYPGWNTILARGWNDDDVNAHTITAWIGILPEYVVLPHAALQRMNVSLRQVLNRIGIVTEEEVG